MKRRWFNFRPLTTVFMSLLLGSLFAFYITKNLVPTLIVGVVVFIASIVIAILYKKATFVILPIVCFIIGLSAFNLAVSKFNKTSDLQPKTVSARIYQINNSKEDVLTVYADSVKFDNKKINCNIVINIYNKNNAIFYDLEIGSEITFNPFATHKTNLNYNEIPNSYYYKNDLKYLVLTNKFEITGVDKTFAERVKEKIKNNLNNGLSEENVEIAYSTLFGDSSMLDKDTKTAFQLSGIAHILAVSGLHIGIIVMLLNKFFKKLKINDWHRVIIISFILAFYCYLCNFSVSVLRASIMSIILMIAPLVGRRYDSLCAISFAGIIQFLINPLCVFDISFLMSYSCVLGIVFISKPISKAITKIKVPKFIADVLALSTSTCISLIFIQAYFFSRINLLSILANALLIPLFTIAFEVIFCLAFVSIIIRPITYLLLPINYILNFINIASISISNLPFANVATVTHNYLLIVVYFFLLLVLGRICTAKKTEKVFISLPIAGLLIAFIV